MSSDHAHRRSVTLAPSPDNAAIRLPRAHGAHPFGQAPAGFPWLAPRDPGTLLPVPPSSRILLVAFTPFPAPTGAATRLAQRILALAGAGYVLDVITPKAAALPHVSTLATARIFRVPLAGLRDSNPGLPRTETVAPSVLADQLAAFERAVRRQLQGNEYEAIHVFDPSATAAILNHRDQALVVYETGGDNLVVTDPTLAAELARRHARLVDSAAAIFVPSRVVGAETEALGAWPTRVHLLRPSVDLELFQPAVDISKRGSATCRIGVVATQLHSDELTLLAGAILRIDPAVDVRVVVSATVEPEDRRQLETDAALRDRFALHKPVLYDDLVPFYSACDAGLVLSTGAPGRPVRLQSAAEILAAGLAPILPDVPAIRELVRGEGDALLVPPGDVGALVEAIELMAGNSRLRRLLGHGARQAATIALDERKAAATVVSVYRDLLVHVNRVTEETPRPVPDAQPMHLHIDSLLRADAATSRAVQSAPDATVSQRTPVRPPDGEYPHGSDDVTLPESSVPSSPGRGRPRPQ